MREHRSGALGELADIFRVRQYFDAISGLRDAARWARADAEFVGAIRRAAVRLPFESPPAGFDPFPARRHRALTELAGSRIAIIASGGSGALAALLGVLRAFEEARLTPSALSCASGAALFGLPVAAGVPAGEVAEFVLGADPTAWCDFDWGGLAAIAPRRGRGFAGILHGDRLEASYRRLLGGLKMRDLVIPAYLPVWSIEHNRLEYLGPRTHPELEVARAIRMAITIPLLLDPVPWHGENWCDGGIVDIFPVRPLLEIEPVPEAVLALNCFYPHGFAGEPMLGWRDREWSIIDVASQVRTAQHVELARRNLARLREAVPRVELLEPVPYSEVRGAGFYAEFLEREDWPRYMRAGRLAGLRALERLDASIAPPTASAARPAGRRRAAGAPARPPTPAPRVGGSAATAGRAGR